MEAGTRTVSARSYFADMVDAGIEEWAETANNNDNKKKKKKKKI